MKGLLLKELYVMRKICRVYLILMVVFIAASVFAGDNLFMVTYPCSLPFMFKLGMTKGRIAYFLSLGYMGFFGVFAYHTIRRQISVQVSTLAVHAAITLAMIGVYALSWYLSIRFYKKREL